MNKNMNVIWTPLLLTGCLHHPADYPGSPASTIEPAKYIDSVCPDLSGTYQSTGYLLQGDVSARDYAKSMFFGMVFPISDPTEWKDVRKKYRVGPRRNDFVLPDFVTVSNLVERSVLVTMHYNDGPIGSYHSDYTKKSKFICMNDRLVWGGKDHIGGRSEWGRNTGNASFAIYKDVDGNLISESARQIHMNMWLGIPAGTAEYFAVYQFRKITPPN